MTHRTRGSLAWPAAVAAAVMAGALGLAGCGSGGSSGTGRQTLEVWIPADTPDTENVLFDGFQKAHPSIKLNVERIPQPYQQTLAQRWATGARPDLLSQNTDAGDLFGAIGGKPDRDLLNLDELGFAKRYNTAAYRKDVGVFDGHRYAAVTQPPLIVGSFYNRQVFAKAGIKDLPRTFDDFIADCKPLRRAGVTPTFVAGGDTWPLEVVPVAYLSYLPREDPSFFPKVNANKTSFADPRVVEGQSILLRLQRAGCLNSDAKSATFDQAGEALYAGKAATVINFTSVVAQLVDAHGLAGVNKRIGYFPITKKGSAVNYFVNAYGTYFVPKTGDDDKQRAAKTFVSYITGPGYGPYQKATKSFPVFKGYSTPADVPTATREARAALTKDTTGTIFITNLNAPWGDWGAQLSKMLAGQISSEEAARQVQANFARNARLAHLPGFS